MVAVTSAAPAPEDSSSSPTRRQKSSVRFSARASSMSTMLTGRGCASLAGCASTSAAPPSRRSASSGSSRSSTSEPATWRNDRRRPVRRGRPAAARPGRLHQELLRNTVEVVTGVCHTVGEAMADLRRTLEVVVPAPTSSGVDLYGGGTHPFASWTRAAADRGAPLRGADQPHPVVGPADADLGRARARRAARAGAGDAGAVLAAQPLPAPAGALGVLADLGRRRHRLRLQPGADVPAAADRRAAVPVRAAGRSSRRSPPTSWPPA